MATTRLNKVANKLVSDLFAPKEFDESAETVEEIAERSGMSTENTRKIVRKMFESGKIERVWKRGIRCAVAAYRIK